MKGGFQLLAELGVVGAALIALDAFALPGQRLGCQLPFQAVLLVAREIAGAGGQVRIVANPIGGEIQNVCRNDEVGRVLAKGACG